MSTKSRTRCGDSFCTSSSLDRLVQICNMSLMLTLSASYIRVMTGYTYILRCADGTFYAGSTKHLADRVEAHRQGLGSDYTTNRRPLELVWSAEFARIDEAFALEKQIQGWSHAKRLAFIEGGWDAIKGWSARERALRRGR